MWHHASERHLDTGRPWARPAARGGFAFLLVAMLAARSAFAAGAGEAPAAEARAVSRLSPAFVATLDSLDALARQLALDGREQEAESLALRFAGETEARHGRESLEAAEALELAVRCALPWSDAWVPEPQPRHRDAAARAHEPARRALRVRTSRLGPDNARVAASLEHLARVEYALGDTAAGRAHAEQSLAVRERALGPDHPQVARVMRLLAAGLSSRDTSLARGLFERALRIQESALGPDDVEVAATLVLMSAEVRGAPRAQRLAWLRRALGIFELRLGSRHYRVAATLNALGFALSWWGDLRAAEDAYLRALEIVGTPTRARHRLAASISNGLGALYAQWLFDPAKAAACFERALELGGEHWVTLTNLAHTRYFLGDAEEARRRYERGLALVDSLFGPGHDNTAYVLANYGNGRVFFENDFVGGERLLRRSLQVFEAMPRPSEFAVRNCQGAWAALAEIASRTGEPDSARAWHERSLAMLERCPGYWNSFEQGLAQDQYAAALARGGDLPASLRWRLEARKSLGQYLSADHVWAVDNLLGLAETHLALGDGPRARELLQQCLAARERAPRPEPLGLAAVLHALARLQRRAGQPDSALQACGRAVAILESVFGRSGPQLAAVLGLRAELLLERADLPGALEAAVRAEAASREHLRATIRAYAESHALHYTASRGGGLDLALALTERLDDPGAVSAAWDAAIRSRGLVQGELAARRRARNLGGDPIAESLATALGRARARLANLAIRDPEWSSGLGSADPGWNALGAEQLRGLFGEAERRCRSLEEALASRSLAFRRERAEESAGYDEIAGALPRDAALVAFVKYREPAAAPGGESRYAAFALAGGNRTPVMVALGEAHAVDGLVAAWRRETSRVPASAREEAACRESGRRLRQAVWDPVARQLGSATRVFVVPDGALSLLSFETLPAAQGGHLVEHGPTLHYLSAERDLVETREAPAGAGLLALGDAGFDARQDGAPPGAPAYRGPRSACGEFRVHRFPALPATAAEVREVSGTWARGAARPGRAEVLLGAAATENAFKSRAPGHRVLHLATHGFFLGGECRSALERTRGMGGLTVAAPLVTEAGENPLLLSGLALAGANRREEAGPNEEDGILTAEEIAALDLSGVEWAVLSACETGVGEVRSGEGVFGLRRAFQVAGARTLVMSLWSVEDEATRAWMRALYEARLERHLDTAESVRAASLKVLQERRAKGQSTHPFWWGAFVAAGDWR